MAKAEPPSAKAAKSREPTLKEPTWENASERERLATTKAAARHSARAERLRVNIEPTPKGFKTVAGIGGIEDSLALRLANAMGTTSQAFSDSMLSNINNLSILSKR